MKLISAAIAATIVSVTAFAPAAQAQQYGRQNAFVGDSCAKNPDWRGCDDWRRNHANWNESNYNDWYHWNQPYLGAAAAGLFGLAAGAAIGASQAQGGYQAGSSPGYDDHVARCEARYRSYSAETDMYLGFDGNHHRCNL